LALTEPNPSINNRSVYFTNLIQKEKEIMKISKQSILISLSVALLLAFSLVTGCVSNQEAAAPAEAAVSDDTVRVPTENVNAFWDDQDWGDMTKAEQALWSTVGYTEEVWIGDAKNPPEEDLYWKQLDPEKQEALKKIGYTESFWNDGDPE
jgi:hypothetical protein